MGFREFLIEQFLSENQEKIALLKENNIEVRVKIRIGCPEDFGDYYTDSDDSDDGGVSISEATQLTSQDLLIKNFFLKN
jgi:hypothetical protein